MVSEVIERIRAAENEAEESLRRARADAKRLVAEAHEESERIFDAMRKEERDGEKVLVEKASAAAEAEAEGIALESRANVEAVTSGAGEKVKAGVRKVLESIAGAA